jgi:hypothetical protein
MKSYQKLFAAFLAVCFMTVAAFAADASPAGTWKWTQQGRNGATEASAKLEFKDGKLTGTIAGPQGDTAIGDGKVEGGNISFTVTREFNDMKMVTKYSGKLEGDKITGSIERPGRGDGAAATKTDWVATRSK